jgi:hypothetical protein
MSAHAGGGSVLHTRQCCRRRPVARPSTRVQAGVCWKSCRRGGAPPAKPNPKSTAPKPTKKKKNEGLRPPAADRHRAGAGQWIGDQFRRGMEAALPLHPTGLSPVSNGGDGQSDGTGMEDNRTARLKTEINSRRCSRSDHSRRGGDRRADVTKVQMPNQNVFIPDPWPDVR